MIYDVGDLAEVSTVITDAAGVPVNTPVVTLTVTRPDGTVLSPAVVNTGVAGRYTAQVPVDVAGLWTFVWAASGTVVAVVPDQFSAQPQRPLIASLSRLKKHVNYDEEDRVDDVELRSHLVAATEVVEHLIEGPVSPQLFTEHHDIRGDRIAPRKRPLVSVTSLATYDGTAVPAEAYMVLTDVGAVRLRRSLVGWHTLVYRAGWQVLPERYKLGGLMIAQHLWNAQNGGGGRVLPGDELVQVPGLGFAIPHRAMELLSPVMAGFA